MRQVKLKIGETTICKFPTTITAHLTQNIFVSLYDPLLKISAACNFSLPNDRNGNKAPHNNKLHFGNMAIDAICKQLKKAGSNLKDLEGQIVGGCTSSSKSNNVKIDLNERAINLANIKSAKEELKKRGVTKIHNAVGGRLERNVKYQSANGKIDIQVTRENRPSRKQIDQAGFPSAKTAPKTPLAREFRAGKKIQVMIVDDSRPLRVVLRKMIEVFPDMDLMHEAESAAEAAKFMARKRPDVITLDVMMDKKDGVTFLKEYMKTTPIPTIMISALDYNESGPIFDSLESGAFDYIKKPSLEEIDSLSNELHEKIKAAYNSRYIDKEARERKILAMHEKVSIDASPNLLKGQLLVIGSSTGGTEALNAIFSKLPKNIPPMVIVQHMPPIFSKTLAERLDRMHEFEVKEAEDGDQIIPGRAIIGAGGKHIRITLEDDNKMVIRLTNDPPVNRFRPSVDYMFDSIPDTLRRRVLGFILTGMGSDGAAGLLNLRKSGARTVAQDETTSVVYGMPKMAKVLGGAQDIVPLHDIPNYIAKFYNMKFKK